MTRSIRDALSAAGFSWPTQHDWPHHEVPIGEQPPSSYPADAGLATEEIGPGVAALRMDPVLLLRDGRIRAPMKRWGMELAIFVCVAIAGDGDETCWVPLTSRFREGRLAIEPEWRLGGNYPWRRRQLFLMDAGRWWTGPTSTFVFAAWREAFSELSERAHLTQEGVSAIRAAGRH